MNTSRAKPGASGVESEAARAVGCVPIRSASFVSIMCDAEVVERGLQVADYFLWNDDFEYSTRLIRGRVGLYVRRGQRRGAQDQGVRLHRRRPGERFFYEVRNKVWMFTRSRS